MWILSRLSVSNQWGIVSCVHLSYKVIIHKRCFRRFKGFSVTAGPDCPEINGDFCHYIDEKPAGSSLPPAGLVYGNSHSKTTFHRMIIDKSQPVLATIDQDICADCADLIDHPGDPGAVGEDAFDLFFSKDIRLRTGIAELVPDVIVCP